MPSRVIPLPLSGGDRKHLKKQIELARSTHAALSQRAAAIRAEGQKMLQGAQDRLRQADILDCKAWNAIVFCGDFPEDSPTIGAAINAGLPLLRVCCNGCSAERDVDLRKLRRSLDSQVHLIEDKLFCEACSGGRGRRQRAHIVRLDTDEEAAP